MAIKLRVREVVVACASSFEGVVERIDLDIHEKMVEVVVAAIDRILGQQEAEGTLVRTPADDTEVAAGNIVEVAEVESSFPYCNYPPFAEVMEGDACRLLDPSDNRAMTLALRASWAWAFAFEEGRDVVDRLVVPSFDCKDRHPFAAAAFAYAGASQLQAPPSLLPSHHQPPQQKI